MQGSDEHDRDCGHGGEVFCGGGFGLERRGGYSA
jgi:hypothetical protein